MEKSQKRQVAYKAKINDILKGDYVKEDGEWTPNYVKINDKKISRVNLMAVAVSKENLENTNQQNIIIDDGSGRILVRSFEQNNNFDKIEVGNFVSVIGRPREYMNDKYIVSEILKKIDNPLWVEIRKLELGKEKVVYSNEDVNKEKVQEEVVEEQIADDVYSKVFKIIKDIDCGEGADTQEVITQARIEKAEEIITKLLEHGDVFEIKPGKLKVLE